MIYLRENSENMNTMNQCDICNSYDQKSTSMPIPKTNPSQSKFVSMPIHKSTSTTPTPLPPQVTTVVTQPTIIEVPEIFDPELQIGPTNEQLQDQMQQIEERKKKMAAKQLSEDVQFQVSMNEQENRIVENLKNTQGFGVFVNGATLYLRSKHNKYVEGHQNGKVKLSKKKSENTKWIVEYVGLNQIALKNSQTKSYLGSHGKHCVLYTIREEKEIWRVEEVKGLYAFMNYKGRFLRGGIVTAVNLDDHCSDKELWNVELCF